MSFPSGRVSLDEELIATLSMRGGRQRYGSRVSTGDRVKRILAGGSYNAPGERKAGGVEHLQARVSRWSSM